MAPGASVSDIIIIITIMLRDVYGVNVRNNAYVLCYIVCVVDAVVFGDALARLTDG